MIRPIELVRKVARYTTAAAPLYYTEADNYIDGGFLANNPSQAVWSEMHTPEYLEPGEQLKPSVIVSLGTGTPREEQLKPTSVKNVTTISQLFELMTMLVTCDAMTV